MSDKDGNSTVPNVIKGTGYFTPMDIAPTEAPGAASVPDTVQEMAGLPTSMNIEPAPSAPTSTDTPQPVSDSSNGTSD